MVVGVRLFKSESKFLVNVLENLSDGQIQQSNKETDNHIGDAQLGHIIERLKRGIKGL